MATVYDSNIQELIKKTADALKEKIKAPEWSIFVKTGVSRERPPVDKDWWYTRAASILRKVYLRGPIGTNKLRIKYGGRKNRGYKPEKTYVGSGKIIRTILQQLEQIEFIKKAEKEVHKGRVITPKGKSFLDKLAK
jgi:small subunit ribosomal protein S19e